MNTYHTGELIEIEGTLAVAGSPIDVSAQTVTAILVHKDRGASSTRVTCTKPGAKGKVLATWPASESSGWALGRYSVQFWTSTGPYCHVMPEIEIAKGWGS